MRCYLAILLVAIAVVARPLVVPAAEVERVAIVAIAATVEVVIVAVEIVYGRSEKQIQSKRTVV